MDAEELQAPPPSEVVGRKMSRSLRLFAVGFIVFVTLMQTLTYVMTYYTINEYALQYFKIYLYPNSDVVFNQTDCIRDINTSSTAYIEQVDVQQMAAKWSVYVSLASGLPIILTGTILSSLTDNYGRKRFIIIPITGTFIKNIFCALAVWCDWNIYYFVIFFFVEGCAGGWVTTLSIGSACIADLSRPDKSRSFLISLMAVSIGVGFVGGTFIAGYIVKTYQEHGYLYPIVVSAGLSLITAILIISVFPETMQERNRSNNFSVIAKVKNLVGFYYDNSQGLRSRYILAIVAFGFLEIGFLGKNTTEIYFATDSPFCLNALELSVFVSLRGIAQEVIGTAFLKLLQFCFIDEVITLLGLISGIAYFVLEGCAVNAMMLYIAPVAGIISALPVTLLRSIMSKMTPPQNQGALFGSIAFFENIYNMFGNVMTGAIYSGTVEIYRGFVFLVLAGFNAMALVLVIILAIKSRRAARDIQYKVFENGQGEAEEKDVSTQSSVKA